MLSSVLWTLAQRGPEYGPGDGHMWGMWGWGWMWLAGPLILVATLALAGLVVWALMRPSRQPSSSGTRRPQEILDDRYARGELSTEEYRERSEILEGSRRRPPV